MTIGIAVSGPLAGLAAFSALRAVERVARGSIGGFVSFVALSDHGRLLSASTQRGGTTTLFTDGASSGALPPPAFATARLAALISSGPDRPEPLTQFSPGDPAGGLVTGHRLPHLRGADGQPLNAAVLARLTRGDDPRRAVEAVLAANPEADAGLIALACDGTLYAADSARVRQRPDCGRFLGENPDIGARCAVLHNAIFPVAPLAALAAAIAFDTMAPGGEADFHVTLAAGTRLDPGGEACLHLVGEGRSEARVERVTVTGRSWLGGSRHGAAVPHGAAVRRGGQLVGRVVSEPYCVAEGGVLVSLGGRDEAIIGVRADAIEGAAT